MGMGRNEWMRKIEGEKKGKCLHWFHVLVVMLLCKAMYKNKKYIKFLLLLTQYFRNNFIIMLK